MKLSFFLSPKLPKILNAASGSPFIVEKFTTSKKDHCWEEYFDPSDFEENTQCPACGGTLEPFTQTEKLDGERGLATGYCPRDGLVVSTRLKSRKWFEAHFQKNWLKRDPRILNLTRDKDDVIMEPFLTIEPMLKAKSKILDIGCGAGFRLKAFQDTGHKVIGVDPSQIEAHRAQKVLNTDIYNQTAEQFFIENNEKFDVIYFFNSLDFMSNPFDVIKRALNSLNEDALLYFKSGTLFQRDIYQVAHFAPIQAHLSWPALKQLLISHGYQVKRLSNNGIDVLAKRASNNSPKEVRENDGPTLLIREYILTQLRTSKLTFGKRVKRKNSKFNRKWCSSYCGERRDIKSDELNKILPIRFIHKKDKLPILLK